MYETLLPFIKPTAFFFFSKYSLKEIGTYWFMWSVHSLNIKMSNWLINCWQKLTYSKSWWDYALKWGCQKMIRDSFYEFLIKSLAFIHCFFFNLHISKLQCYIKSCCTLKVNLVKKKKKQQQLNKEQFIWWYFPAHWYFSVSAL